MALITCYECSTEISDQAAACPKCGAPQSKKMREAAYAKTPEGKKQKLNVLVFWLMLVALVIAIVAYNVSRSMSVPRGTASAAPASDYVKQPWRLDPNFDIAKTLAANNAAGCGQFKFREHPSMNGEYLVYCTRDGSSWQSYLVWPRTGKVLGPHRPAAQIPG